MARGKGNLANSLAKQQNEQRQKQIKRIKLENKKIHYPTNGKKPKKINEKKANEEDNDDKQPIDESKVFIPFDINDRILIVGDGDFSYSLSIINKKLIKPYKLIVTSYDTLDELYEKYGIEIINNNISKLKELGVSRIYHGIDCTKLCESLGIQIKNKRHGDGSGKSIEILGGLNVKNIIFNFPHIGKHIKDVNRNILKNQELIHGFFKSCLEFYNVLRKQREACKGDIEEKIEIEIEENLDNIIDIDDLSNGYYSFNNNKDKKDEDFITITLFNGEPYDSWKIKKIARDSIGYSVQRSGKLEWKFYEGYQHRRTAGLGETNKESRSREVRIYKFEKFVYINKKRKRGGDESDSDDD
jgi:25S rRNA (uracil2634-N3)-methyltransferase